MKITHGPTSSSRHKLYIRAGGKEAIIRLAQRRPLLEQDFAFHFLTLVAYEFEGSEKARRGHFQFRLDKPLFFNSICMYKNGHKDPITISYQRYHDTPQAYPGRDPGKSTIKEGSSSGSRVGEAIQETKEGLSAEGL